MMDDSEPPSSSKSLPSLVSKANSADQAISSPLGQKKTDGFFTNILRIVGLKDPQSIEDQVTQLIEENDPEQLHITARERLILQNVLRFNEKTVHDVMTPRTDIVAIDETSSIEDIQSLISEKEHTRMPVYRETLDNIIGFIHIKDIISLLFSQKSADSISIESIIREGIFVPPSKHLLDMLFEMQAKRIHMAVVVDEYGATDGILTMEDIVEEIVGEIEDEHDDVEASYITPVDERSWRVNARMPLDELEAIVGLPLRYDENMQDLDTLGGLIFYVAGRVPEEKERVEHPNGLLCKIVSADPRRIHEVIVTKL